MNDDSEDNAVLHASEEFRSNLTIQDIKILQMLGQTIPKISYEVSEDFLLHSEQSNNAEDEKLAHMDKLES